MVVLIVLVFLLVLALVMGVIGAVEISVGLEINMFQSPFYKIGIVSDRHYLTDGSVEDELIIGLLFVNIVFVFWKPLDNSDII